MDDLQDCREICPSWLSRISVDGDLVDNLLWPSSIATIAVRGSFIIGNRADPLPFSQGLWRACLRSKQVGREGECSGKIL